MVKDVEALNGIVVERVSSLDLNGKRAKAQASANTITSIDAASLYRGSANTSTIYFVPP